jgi:hypothetical protein
VRHHREYDHATDASTPPAYSTVYGLHEYTCYSTEVSVTKVTADRVRGLQQAYAQITEPVAAADADVPIRRATRTELKALPSEVGVLLLPGAHGEDEVDTVLVIELDLHNPGTYTVTVVMGTDHERLAHARWYVDQLE